MKSSQSGKALDFALAALPLLAIIGLFSTYGEHPPLLEKAYLVVASMMQGGSAHELYSSSAQLSWSRELNSFGIGFGYFAYPPNSLPLVYIWSLLPPQYIWLFNNLIVGMMTVGMLYIIFRRMNEFWLKAISAIGVKFFPPFIHAIELGQVSGISALSVFFYYFFSIRGRRMLSGFFLALCWFKPQIGLPLTLLPLLLKDIKSIGWAMLFTSMFCLIGLGLIGLEGYSIYFEEVYSILLEGDTGGEALGRFSETLSSHCKHNIMGLMSSLGANDIAIGLAYFTLLVTTLALCWRILQAGHTDIRIAAIFALSINLFFFNGEHTYIALLPVIFLLLMLDEQIFRRWELLVMLGLLFIVIPDHLLPISAELIGNGHNLSSNLIAISQTFPSTLLFTVYLCIRYRHEFFLNKTFDMNSQDHNYMENRLR